MRCGSSGDAAVDELDRKAALGAAIADGREGVLVVNTQSRRGHRLYGAAKHLLTARGFTLTTYAVNHPERLPGIVSDAIDRGHRLVIVGGGDGTISSVVDRFASRDTVLGLLPLGTANSFARALGIPLTVEAAVEAIVSGKVVDVDLGRIDGAYFANAAAIGLPASIARHMPRLLKRWLGRAGYLLVACFRLLRHRAFDCEVEIDADRHRFTAWGVRVANGQYQGGVRVADEASVESHDLVVQAIEARTRWSVVRFWANALLGMPTRTEDVLVFRGHEVTIATTPRQYVSVDGEVAARTPVHASVARDALLVLVPTERTALE
jgi:YegS/Rv2252/BmrU family lipid kinase